MDEMDELHARMRITNLEAKLALCDIERADLKRVVNSPSGDSAQVSEALHRSKVLAGEHEELAAKLAQLRTQFPGLARK